MNVGATVPGPVSAGTQPARIAGDGKCDTDFGSHLRNAEQSGQPSRSQDQTKPEVSLQPRWPGFAAKFSDGDDKATAADETTDPSAEGGNDAATSATDETKDKDREVKHAEISLLIAPSPPRAVPASDEADAKGKAAAGVAQAPESNASESNQLETIIASVAANEPTALPRDKARATEVRNGKSDILQSPTLPGAPGSANSALDEEASQAPGPAFDMKDGKEPTKATPRNSRVDAQAASPGHVVVTGEHNFPAPAQHPASPTVTSLASAIAQDGGARAAFSPSNGLPQWATTVATSSHMLKIELHPAELGMVTANLRLSGGQLSIELTPENHEAHRRLSSDADSLVKSLHAMGFDVDKVTVLQPSIAAPATVRTDNASMGGAPGGRDSSSFQSGNSGGGGNMSGGQQSGRDHNHDGQNHGQNATPPRLLRGGDLFI